MKCDMVQGTKDGAVGELRGLRPLWRFFRSLRLTVWLSPLVLVLIACATGLPQVFVWYVGAIGGCNNDAASCTSVMDGTAWSVPITPQGVFILILLCLVSRVLAWIVFEVSGQWASLGLHRKVIEGLSNVRVTYFDQNPSGEILNKLMGDFERLRVTGVLRMGDSVSCLTDVVFIAGLVFFSSPWVALCIFPVLILFFYIQSLVTPMLEHLGTITSARLGEFLHRETDLIEGGRIFSLYGKQGSLLESIHASYVRLLSVEYTKVKVEAWHRFWTGFVALAYTALAVVVVAVALFQRSISEALAAVIVTATFRLAPSFSMLFDSTSVLSEFAANAKRVYEIVDLTPELRSEGAARLVGRHVHERALVGDLTFADFAMSYRSDTPLILDGLNLTLKAGKRTGVVGRTGAGKTSLVQSVFRMAYVHRGDILLSGRSIFEVDIRRLRKAFGIVPQQPYLFSGTVRSNLDRTRSYSDEHLRNALVQVGLRVELDGAVKEGGSNFSVGERQLLCLARILASGKEIVFMDEPTSAIDPESDARIQRVLRTAFSGKTVVTIAHRLETLANCDEVVELASGKVVFQGAPAEAISRWRFQEVGVPMG
jgi:ABC-type multidrug transport system fused ATPase/permease subunit